MASVWSTGCGVWFTLVAIVNEVMMVPCMSLKVFPDVFEFQISQHVLS